MASPNTNLRVRISADLAQFQQGLGTLRRSVSGLGGVLAGALAGLSVGAVVGSIVRATMESEQAMAQLEARLKSTKGAAGLTKDELVDMAGALQGVSTYGDEAIMGAQSMLLTFTKIGRDVFPQATEAVLNMATAMGTDLNSASVQIGKALNDPIKGVSALGRAGVQFTQGQKDMIERLVETGRTMDAQKIILRELETQFGGAARAARDTMGGAFTALKEAAGDLLEGDTGSDGVRGVKSSIEQLTKLLQDPRTKEAFASMANGVFQLANAFVTLATEARDAWTSAQRWLTFKLGGTKNIDDLQQIRYEMGQVQGIIEDIEGSGSFKRVLAGPDLQAAQRRLRELKELEEMSVLLFGDGQAKPGFEEKGRTSTPGKGRWANINGDPTTNVAADEAADKSKKKLEELRRAQERLRREAERAEEARKAELEAQRSRIESGIRDVEIALARATGREADAAWMEIDDRFKQLIADLKATGNKEGEELVNRLIDIEKADARMAEFKRRFEQALDGFGQPDQAAPVVGQEPGQQLVDEAALEAARQRSLTTLRALRDAALTYANTLSGPAKEAALASIRDMDQALGGLKKSFGETTIAAADMAIAGVSDFFYDWATGAKSFKNALSDAVDTFAKGLLRMSTEAAALVLVLKGFDLFMPGFSQFFMQLRGGGGFKFHGGGVVGEGGGSRIGNLNPLMFGTAPRYHTGGFAGLGSDEVAAVLRKGEEVLTEDDPRHAKNGGKGRGGDVFVNVQNNSSTPAQVNERMSGGDRIIDVVIGAVASDIGRNGAVGKAIGQRFGVQPVGALRG